LVRVSVLYEDLKLEFEGASAGHINGLDVTGIDYRRFYFLRRTTATLLEFRGAFLVLQQNASFKKLKHAFPPDREKAWSEAVGFPETNHAAPKNLRN
jgi:hypothetical protein